MRPLHIRTFDGLRRVEVSNSIGLPFQPFSRASGAEISGEKPHDVTEYDDWKAEWIDPQNGSVQ